MPCESPATRIMYSEVVVKSGREDGRDQKPIKLRICRAIPRGHGKYLIEEILLLFLLSIERARARQKEGPGCVKELSPLMYIHRANIYFSLFNYLKSLAVTILSSLLNKGPSRLKVRTNVHMYDSNGNYWGLQTTKLVSRCRQGASG